MSFVNRILRSLGYELRAYPRPDFVLREVFERHPFGLLLDVGANTGQSLSRFRRNGFAGRIVSFEPLPDACAELRRKGAADPSWSLCETCVGEADGQVELVVGGGDGQSSSILETKAERCDALAERAPVSRISVPIRSLDSLRNELGIEPRATFLKIDVQGAELQVLAGASGMLGSIAAIQTEMAVVPSYVGQPLFSDVLRYLHDRGFYLHHLYNGWTDPATGELYEVDGIFLNRSLFGQNPSPSGDRP